MRLRFWERLSRLADLSAFFPEFVWRAGNYVLVPIGAAVMGAMAWAASNWSYVASQGWGAVVLVGVVGGSLLLFLLSGAAFLLSGAAYQLRRYRQSVLSSNRLGVEPGNDGEKDSYMTSRSQVNAADVRHNLQFLFINDYRCVKDTREYGRDVFTTRFKMVNVGTSLLTQCFVYVVDVSPYPTGGYSRSGPIVLAGGFELDPHKESEWIDIVQFTATGFENEETGEKDGYLYLPGREEYSGIPLEDRMRITLRATCAEQGSVEKAYRIENKGRGLVRFVSV